MQKENALCMTQGVCNQLRPGLHRAGDLAGTEAAGAHIYVLRRTVHNRLYALNVGLPGAIGTPMRVRDLDAEADTLAAEITFGHDLTSSLVKITYQKDIV